MPRIALKGRLLLSVALAAAVALGTPAEAQDSQSAWRVGLAAVCVTPEGPIRMAGYAGRKQPSEGVLDDLFVKAMAVEDAQGNRGLWITADLIGFRASVAALICPKIIEKTGLRREQIILCPSHTHAGPVLGFREIGLYNLPDDQRAVVEKYTHRVINQLVKLSEEALADLKPARLSWGIGTAEFVMNRREFTERGVRLGVNPSGYVDRAVPVLRVDSPKGKLRAVVFGCACHNTTGTGKNLEIYGDYAGFAQRAIQKQHPGVQAMFVIGCGGDSNPYPRGTNELAIEHGQNLGAEVCRVLQEKKMAPVEGPLVTKLRWVDLPLAPVGSRSQLEEMTRGSHWIKYNAKRMLEALDKGETLLAEYRAPFAVWQFGDDLTLVGMSGETVGGYVPLLQDALGHRKLWIAGYTNDCFGYLPTAKVIAQGGYETRGLIPDIGFFVPEVEKVVVDAVRDLAKQAGRTLGD